MFPPPRSAVDADRAGNKPSAGCVVGAGTEWGCGGTRLSHSSVNPGEVPGISPRFTDEWPVPNSSLSALFPPPVRSGNRALREEFGTLSPHAHRYGDRNKPTDPATKDYHNP